MLCERKTKSAQHFFKNISMVQFSSFLWFENVFERSLEIVCEEDVSEREKLNLDPTAMEFSETGERVDNLYF